MVSKRVAYLDCFAGISGDMFLGAMVGAGVELEVMERAVAALGLGAGLRARTVDRSGISATKVEVLEGEALAEGESAAVRDAGVAEQGERVTGVLPKTQHLHKGGHAHTHEHTHGEEGHKHTHGESGHTHGHGDGAHEGGHVHGRSLSVIEGMIRGSTLEEGVKRRALRAFRLLGESEAKIHNVPVEEIHFHEVGAVDAIVDIVGASAGVEEMERRAREETGAGLRWCCSAVNVGGGMVDCAHGRFPVPAPATADLLRGVPTYGAHVEKELVTPTGAALLRMLEAEFGGQPPMRVERIGYGAGTRDPKGFPNVLRLMVGEAGDGAGEGTEGARETVVVLETAVDDMTAQVVAHVADRLLERGALDVMTSAVGMKKGRQGMLLTVLAEEGDAAAMEEVLLRETTTLGVRRRREERARLSREHVTVETEFGPVRVKVGRRGDEELNARPEFEDCRAAAVERGVPLKRVMEAAVVAYRTR